MVKNKTLRKIKYKTKRFLAKNHYYISLLVVILIFSGIVCVCLSPFVFQYIVNEGDLSSRDYDSSYTYNDIIYDYAMYVHKDGDNSDGETWETAYTTINRANIMASLDLDDKTIIFVGIGVFDVNVAEQLDIHKNVHIVGSGRDATIFTNTHDNADYVLNVTRYFKMENCEIFVNDTYSGIQVYGNNSDVNLVHMRFMAGAGAVDIPIMLHLLSGDHGEFEDLHIGGIGTIVIGIYLNGSSHNHFTNIEIFRCKGAITFEGADTDENHVINSRIYGSPKGLDIRSGNGQHFEDMFFQNCVMAVDDEVGDSSWFNVYTDTMLGAIQPQDLVGVDVDTHAITDTYGADVLILDASDEDVPYYIVAVLFEPDVKEKYGLRLWVGTGYFYETVIEAKFLGEIDRHTIEMPRIFNAHSMIYCSIKSESGGNDMDIWLEIVSI